MSESGRDAFGMPIDDTDAAAPASVAVPVAGSGTASASAQAFGPPRRSVVPLLFSLLCLVATGLVLWQAERDAGSSAPVVARELGTDTSSTPLAPGALDAAVPERIVRAALRQAGVDDGHLDAVYTTGGDAPSWFISLVDVPIADRSWTADLAGVAVTRPGELAL